MRVSKTTSCLGDILRISPFRDREFRSKIITQVVIVIVVAVVVVVVVVVAAVVVLVVPQEKKGLCGGGLVYDV